MSGALHALSPPPALHGALRATPAPSPRRGPGRALRRGRELRVPVPQLPAGAEADVLSVGAKEILKGARGGGCDVVGALQPEPAAHEEAREGLKSHRGVRVVRADAREKLGQQLAGVPFPTPRREGAGQHAAHLDEVQAHPAVGDVEPGGLEGSVAVDKRAGSCRERLQDGEQRVGDDLGASPGVGLCQGQGVRSGS